MKTKLNLNIDEQIIKEAKLYAKKYQVSLSKLIENYLLSLTMKEKKVNKVSNLVESLTGIINLETKEYKNEYSDYLAKKY
jgi:hypothetical protein